MDPEELFDRVVIELNNQENEAAIHASTPTEIVKPEENVTEIPKNKQVLQALETIELYAAGHGDYEAFGRNFDIVWYKQVVEGRQTTVDEFFKKNIP